MEEFGMTPALWWLLFALLLGGVELLTMSFFLLWPALAALIVSLLVWLFPGMHLAVQLVIFAALSVVLLVPGRKWVRKSMLLRNETKINSRGEQMVGSFGRIVSGSDGVYRAKVGDSEWSARSNDVDLKSGTQVRVVSVDGITLFVEPV